MFKNKSWLFILVAIICLYLSKDLIASFLINKDSNLNTKALINTEYENLKKEYEQLIDFKNINEEGTISKVILRDPLVFFNTMTILKGKDTIEKESAVYNNDGLIGIVSDVFDNYSTVKLLYNQDVKISVKIGNVYGILECNNNELKIKNITSKEKIDLDTLVVTSDYGQLPENIPIGTISQIKEENNFLSLELTVTPIVDFKNINYVYVRKR